MELKRITHAENVRLSDSGRAVRILDQSRLPNETVYLELSQVEDLYEAIASLRVRGAPAIGIFAGYALYVLALQSQETQYGPFLEACRRNRDYLNSSRPTAVNLRHMLDRVLAVAESMPCADIPSIQAAMGQGYNSVRDIGMGQEIAVYNGELGKALETANRIAGENKAYLDNLQEKYQIEALGAVLRGSATSVYSGEDKEKLQAMREEYSQAMYQYNNGDQEAGLKLENIQENAQALAKAAFEASDAYQSYQSAELDQIGGIREDVAGLRAAWAAGLKIQNAFTIGLGGAAVGQYAAGGTAFGSTLAIGRDAYSSAAGLALTLEQLHGYSPEVLFQMIHAQLPEAPEWVVRLLLCVCP